jgi:hypothetical protein
MRRIAPVSAGLVCLLCLGFLASCSKTLTRRRAANLIESQQRLPRAQTIIITESYFSRELPKPVRGFGTVAVCIQKGEQFSGSQKDRLVYFQSQGLLNIGFTTTDGSCPAIYAKVSLTDAARKYLVSATNGKYELRAGSLVLDQVTGILSQSQQNVATADYTIRLADITPFGVGLSSAPIRETSSFVLYDDGWRIHSSNVVGASLSYDRPADTRSLHESRSAIAAAEASAQAAHDRGETKVVWALQPAALALLKRADALHGTGDNAGALEAYIEAVKTDFNAVDLGTIARYAPFRYSTIAPPPSRPGTAPSDEQAVARVSSLQLAALRQYLQRRPDDWEATQALLPLIDLPEGEALLAPLFKSRPRDPELYAARAALHRHHGHFSTAVEYAAKAADLDPMNSERHVLVGVSAHTAIAENGAILRQDQKHILIGLGLAALKRAETLRPEYFESLVYRSLLLRQKAVLETDPSARKKLIAEADETRQEASDIVARRRRGSK